MVFVALIQLPGKNTVLHLSENMIYLVCTRSVVIGRGKMKKILLVSMSALFASNAFATLITFDELSEGEILSNQYAGLGVNFSAGHVPIAGLSSPTGTFATNTSMEVTSATGTDVGALGEPNLVSGNVLHSFSGFLSEDGDPSFTITFNNAIDSVSLDFAGVAVPSSSRLIAVSGGSIVASVEATTSNIQETLSLTGIYVNEIIVTPGEFFDWACVDNLRFTEAVPEPASMVILGGAALAAISRRRKK
jgi:hypothetical protein